MQISEYKMQKQILDSCLQCKMCMMCTVAEWHAALPSRYLRFHKDGASTNLMKKTFSKFLEGLWCIVVLRWGGGFERGWVFSFRVGVGVLGLGW